MSTFKAFSEYKEGKMYQARPDSYFLYIKFAKRHQRSALLKIPCWGLGTGIREFKIIQTSEKKPKVLTNVRADANQIRSED